jgi:putative YhdH/YhfP family quinone oxidoreductase
MMTESFKAFVAQTTDGAYKRGVMDVPRAWLPDTGTLVEVKWSGVNFKDALAASEFGKVARISPLIIGIDLAGVVLTSDVEWIQPGDNVLAHGYDIGVARHGGLSSLANVPAEWVVPLPKGLSLRESMAIGTAGYTAALSVLALREHGVTTDQGPVLVTGATGGVGSLAVNMLAQLGYEVVASTGKTQSTSLLKRLGASDVMSREDLLDSPKPLMGSTWAGVVDSVGGPRLASILKQVKAGGVVSACGNVGGVELPTTVLPFILRGITMVGIDSVSTPIEKRRLVWEKLGEELKPGLLGELVREIGLEDVEEALTTVSNGGTMGRFVVSTQH